VGFADVARRDLSLGTIVRRFSHEIAQEGAQVVELSQGVQLHIIGLRWWAGWGSGLDPHTLVKTAPAVLRVA
jgi:hypothetical protein